MTHEVTQDSAFARAQRLIASAVANSVALEEVEQAFIAKSRAAKKASTEHTALALSAASARMTRGERLELAAIVYWTTSLRPRAILEALGFHPPVGFPREGIPLLLTAHKCSDCGHPVVLQSRGGHYGWQPTAPRCSAFGCHKGHRAHLREYAKTRGLVSFASGHLEWVDAAVLDEGAKPATERQEQMA